MPEQGTRVACLYNFVGRFSGDEQATVPLHHVFDFGRFRTHFEVGSDLLPRMVLDEVCDASILTCGDDALPVRGVQVLLTVTPRGALVLALELTMPTSAGVDDVVEVLALTCMRRHLLRVERHPVTAWLSSRIGWCVPALGSDVHQIVFLSGALVATVREEVALSSDNREYPPLPPSVTRIVHRGGLGLQVPSGIRTPGELNVPGKTLVAHGRGVSVVADLDEREQLLGSGLESALSMVAVNLMSALAVVGHARRRAFDALRLNERTSVESTTDARQLIVKLAAELNDMQLDLSFGVELYIDSVLIPESVVESFQFSLREAVRLPEGLANSSRVVERVKLAIDARLSDLEAADQRQRERRNRVLSSVVATGSLMALPPALLLAFLGVNGSEVDDDRSIFDFAYYWPAYLAAWLPFLILAGVGFLLHRRLRRPPRRHRRETGKI